MITVARSLCDHQLGGGELKLHLPQHFALEIVVQCHIVGRALVAFGRGSHVRSLCRTKINRLWFTPHKIKQRVIACEKESPQEKREVLARSTIEFCANADEHVHDYISTVYFEHPWHVIVRVSLEYFGSVVFTFLILYYIYRV